VGGREVYAAKRGDEEEAEEEKDTGSKGEGDGLGERESCLLAASSNNRVRHRILSV